MLVIKILGPDCRRRNKILNQIRKTLDASQIPYEVTLITDAFEIMAHGRLNTPAVIVNGNVVAMNSIPKAREILKWETLSDSSTEPV